jgi:hypothetical protein
MCPVGADLFYADRRQNKRKDRQKLQSYKSFTVFLQTSQKIDKSLSLRHNTSWIVATIKVTTLHKKQLV